MSRRVGIVGRRPGAPILSWLPSERGCRGGWSFPRHHGPAPCFTPALPFISTPMPTPFPTHISPPPPISVLNPLPIANPDRAATSVLISATTPPPTLSSSYSLKTNPTPAPISAPQHPLTPAFITTPIMSPTSPPRPATTLDATKTSGQPPAYSTDSQPSPDSKAAPPVIESNFALNTKPTAGPTAEPNSANACGPAPGPSFGWSTSSTLRPAISIPPVPLAYSLSPIPNTTSEPTKSHVFRPNPLQTLPPSQHSAPEPAPSLNANLNSAPALGLTSAAASQLIPATAAKKSTIQLRMEFEELRHKVLAMYSCAQNLLELEWVQVYVRMLLDAAHELTKAQDLTKLPGLMYMLVVDRSRPARRSLYNAERIIRDVLSREFYSAAQSDDLAVMQRHVDTWNCMKTMLDPTGARESLPTTKRNKCYLKSLREEEEKFRLKAKEEVRRAKEQGIDPITPTEKLEFQAEEPETPACNLESLAEEPETLAHESDTHGKKLEVPTEIPKLRVEVLESRPETNSLVWELESPTKKLETPATETETCKVQLELYAEETKTVTILTEQPAKNTLTCTAHSEPSKKETETFKIRAESSGKETRVCTVQPEYSATEMYMKQIKTSVAQPKAFYKKSPTIEIQTVTYTEQPEPLAMEKSSCADEQKTLSKESELRVEATEATEFDLADEILWTEATQSVQTVQPSPRIESTKVDIVKEVPTFPAGISTRPAENANTRRRAEAREVLLRRLENIAARANKRYRKILGRSQGEDLNFIEYQLSSDEESDSSGSSSVSSDEDEPSPAEPAPEQRLQTDEAVSASVSSKCCATALKRESASFLMPPPAKRPPDTSTLHVPVKRPRPAFVYTPHYDGSSRNRSPYRSNIRLATIPSSQSQERPP